MVREWGIPFAREAMLSGRTVSPAELRPMGAVHGIAADTGGLNAMVEDYLDTLGRCAPLSATACKELTQLAWTDPDGPAQDEFIEQTFEAMMAPGAEGTYGIEQFGKKVREIDWADFHRLPSSNL